MLDAKKLIAASRKLQATHAEHETRDYDQLIACFARHATTLQQDAQLRFTGRVTDQLLCEPVQGPYTVIGVDGSQIYPDRHSGVPWYMINLGSIMLRYGSQQSDALRDTRPSVYQTIDDLPALINARRTVQELAYGIELATTHASEKTVLLVDGPLQFFDRDILDPLTEAPVLEAYIQLLQRCYEQQIIIGGYTSMPRSRELLALLRRQQPDAVRAVTQHDFFVDADIMASVLAPLCRTTLFSPYNYPGSLQIQFLYYATGSEIVRIELPVYVARNESAFTTLISVIVDQITKGIGYPVVLAEAHEQAVVREKDRQFFYQLFETENTGQTRRSQKSNAKRRPTL